MTKNPIIIGAVNASGGAPVPQFKQTIEIEKK